MRKARILKQVHPSGNTTYLIWVDNKNKSIHWKYFYYKMIKTVDGRYEWSIYLNTTDNDAFNHINSLRKLLDDTCEEYTTVLNGALLQCSKHIYYNLNNLKKM